MKKIFILLMMALATCNISAKSNFVQVKDGHFVRDGKPYYYVGTNFWYGAILGSEGQGGNRERLCRELDKMKEMGIDNLRILVGSDGKRGVKTKVEPTLQEAPGVYNDTILAGLDYLLMEMGKRKMLAVLYLNNSWEWSGGYGYYLEQAGLGQAPRPNEDGYPAFMNFVAKYASCEKAHQLFYDYVKFILTRTNRYTEEFYAKAKDADYIIYNSTIDGELSTIDELLAKSNLLADFKAVKDGNVWCTGKNLFQETTELGTMIEDIHTILTTDDDSLDELAYMHKLK